MGTADFPAYFDHKPSPMQNYTKNALFKPGSELCDVISFMIYCTGDSTLLLVAEQSNEYWIPSAKVQENGAWISEIMKDELNDNLGLDVPVSRLLHLNKIWVPNHGTPYICHAIFQVNITADVKKRCKNPFGKYKNKVRWVSEEDLTKLTQNCLMKSPEVLHYFWSLRSKPSPLINPPDHSTVGNVTEVTENVLVSTKNSAHDLLIEASKIHKGAQEVIYKEFLLMTFPAVYLNLQVFTRFLVDIGWSKEEAPSLFRSADRHSRSGLSFREFLYFLAAIEPGSAPGGPPAETRCRYIFRYLDNQRNLVLKRDEIRQFMYLVRKARKQPLDAPKIEKDVNDCYTVLGIPDTYGINMAEFLKAVAELKIRGATQIYRSPISIHKYVKEITERKQRLPKMSDAGQSYNMAGQQVGSHVRGHQTYEMAVHSIKIHQSGTAINIEYIWNIDNATSLSSGLPKSYSEASRKISTDQFDQQSKSNELLKAMRYVTKANKKMFYYGKFESFNYIWGDLNPNHVAENVISVCAEVREIFLKEPRLLNVSSPVYIMGDLHGNIASLLNFERILWHVGPGLCPCKLLFLGDYVDRGLFSLEVICYLFSYKLQSPMKLQMLRGNHEIKRVQQQWTFERECKLKFGEKTGLQVFNAINEVFDTLPLAAVVDGRVFCCHGGIPPPWLCPVAAAINDVPSVLSEPQDQSALAWELMWNDPIRAKTVSEKVAMEMLANEGFAMNLRRGTAHIFNVEALQKFLSSNGFTHLVRAHEVVEAGFYEVANQRFSLFYEVRGMAALLAGHAGVQLQQKGHLITVFSSSKYCGGQNMAACVFADQGKLRILRIESE